MALSTGKTFVEVLEQLKITTGTNDKISILKENELNGELKAFLKLALDNSITFGIAQFEYTAGVGIFDDVRAMENFTGLCYALEKRSLTGTAALDEIKRVFANFSSLQAYWLERCLKKDLSTIGIGRSTVEKVWPLMCGKFKCNLAEEESELSKFDWSSGASEELKLNGVRTLAEIVNTRIIWIKGRSGLEIGNFYYVLRELEAMTTFSLEDFVLDGEVHCDNSLENTMTVFSFDFGKTRADFKTDKAYQKWVTEKLEPNLILREKCTYDIFAILPKNEFDTLTCEKTYLEMREVLKVLAQCLKDAGITKVRVVDSVPIEVRNLEILKKKEKLTPAEEVLKAAAIKAATEQAISVANSFMVIGLEGGILKSNEAKYEYKRARNFIKIKECTGEIEAQIIGIEISKDVYNTDGSVGKPQAGRIMLKYKNPKGTYSESGCGTGKWLTKAKKEEIAADPDSFLLSIVTISGQRFSEDDILIVPRIERARPDRTSLDE
jgi:hypothetical protein